MILFCRQFCGRNSRRVPHGSLRHHGLGEYNKVVLFLKVGDLVQRAGSLVFFPTRVLHPCRALFFLLLSCKVASPRRDKTSDITSRRASAPSGSRCFGTGGAGTLLCRAGLGLSLGQPSGPNSLGLGTPYRPGTRWPYNAAADGGRAGSPLMKYVSPRWKEKRQYTLETGSSLVSPSGLWSPAAGPRLLPRVSTDPKFQHIRDVRATPSAGKGPASLADFPLSQ